MLSFSRSRKGKTTFGPVLCLSSICLVAATLASNEDHTARYFESIRRDPNALLIFLRAMPKGGDLHNQLLEAVYAESVIQWASDGGLCVNRKTLFIVQPPCDPGGNLIPVRNSLADPFLYREMVDAYSMRNWQLSGQSGHDHFFDSFDKFLPATDGNTGAMLAETATRAASFRSATQSSSETKRHRDYRARRPR